MREDRAWVQLKAAADAAAVRGSLLFHLDLALALGIAALRDAGLAGDLHTAIVDNGGYAVLAMEDGPVPQMRGIARFAADGRPLVTGCGGAAVMLEAALARARRTVARARPTGDIPATVIAVPQRTGAGLNEPIEVYTLAQATVPGNVVLGIHWHATVSADGTTLLAREPLSRSALIIPSHGETPPFAVTATHFGPVPSEIHSWLSLKHGLPLSVAALESGVVWTVDGERTTREGLVSG